MKKSKIIAYKLSMEEYIDGQTWCIEKKYHMFFCYKILFLIGIMGELYSIAVEKEVSRIIIISIIAVLFYIINIRRIAKIASEIYITEPTEFSLIFENKGFTIRDISNELEMFYPRGSIKKIKKLKRVYVLFFSKNIYFFVPRKLIENNTYDLF